MTFAFNLICSHLGLVFESIDFLFVLYLYILTLVQAVGLHVRHAFVYLASWSLILVLLLLDNSWAFLLLQLRRRVS